MRKHSKTALFSISILLYITRGHPRFDVCKVTMQGQEYNGNINKTVSGLTCQRWDSQIPHRHSRDNFITFRRATTSQDENFCRNPDLEPKGPWCYTMNPKVRWEYCPVPFCDEYFPPTKIDAIGRALRTRDPKNDRTNAYGSKKTIGRKSPIPYTDAHQSDDVTDVGTNFMAPPSSNSTHSDIKLPTFPKADIAPERQDVGMIETSDVKTSRENITHVILSDQKSFQDEIDNLSLALSEDDVEEAPGAVYIGSFGVIVIVLFISFLVALDMTTYYNNLRFLYENIQDLCHTAA